MGIPSDREEVRTRDGAGSSDSMVEVRFLMPATWRDELAAAARVQRISMADLMRIVTRGFLRQRYDEPEQRRLGLIQ